MTFFFGDRVLNYMPGVVYTPVMGRPAGSRNKINSRIKFPAYYTKDAGTGCWNWIKSRGTHGYGYFRNDGHLLAHRWTYATFLGPIPDGMFVLHRCDNRACVNPDHLFLGTALDNARDTSNKGRVYSKGKTFEEVFGGERATQLKENLRQLGISGRGKKRSEAARKRMAIAQGVAQAKPETKAKKSVSMLASWRTRKESLR